MGDEVGGEGQKKEREVRRKRKVKDKKSEQKGKSVKKQEKSERIETNNKELRKMHKIDLIYPERIIIEPVMQVTNHKKREEN